MSETETQLAIILERLAQVTADMRQMSRDVSLYHSGHERAAGERHQAVLAKIDETQKLIERGRSVA